MTAHHPQTILGLVPFTALQSRLDAVRGIRQEKPMLTTIAVAGHITAQGDKIAEHADGRVTISTGIARLTGWPIGRLPKGAMSAIALATLSLGGTPNLAQAETILNVS